MSTDILMCYLILQRLACAHLPLTEQFAAKTVRIIRSVSAWQRPRSHENDLVSACMLSRQVMIGALRRLINVRLRLHQVLTFVLLKCTMLQG